jgi:hypothetical protein
MVCEITGLILKTCGLGDRAAAAATGCGGRGGDVDKGGKGGQSWPLF